MILCLILNFIFHSKEESLNPSSAFIFSSIKFVYLNPRHLPKVFQSLFKQYLLIIVGIIHVFFFTLVIICHRFYGHLSKVFSSIQEYLFSFPQDLFIFLPIKITYHLY